MKKFFKFIICFLIIFITAFNVFAKEKQENIFLQNSIPLGRKLVFDAKNETVIDYENFMENMDKYDKKYLFIAEPDNFEMIISNLPEEYNIKVFTIKEIDKQNLTFLVQENNNSYAIDKESKVKFIYPHKYDNNKNISNFKDVEKNTKILLYLDDKNNVKKCFVTPFKSLSKSIINNKAINIEGRFIEQVPYFIKDKLYLPIRPIAEAFGYNIYWDSNTKCAVIEKDNQKIIIKTNYENFIKDSSIYVPKYFIEMFLKIDVEEKDNIIYIG